MQNRREKIILNLIHFCFHPFRICLWAVPWLCWWKGCISGCCEKFRGSGSSGHSPRLCLHQGNAVGFVRLTCHSEHRPWPLTRNIWTGKRVQMATKVLECSMDRTAECCTQISHQNPISEAAPSCWEMFQELATPEGAAGATRMGGAAVRRSLTQERLFQGFRGILTSFLGAL